MDGMKKDNIIKEALERFESSQEGSEWNREAFYEDVKFARLAEQWPDAVKKQRIQEGRPVLVINKMPALIRSIVNESRQNKPAISVAPVDGGADEDTAEVIGGLIRSIERNSNASLAYDTAIDHAVTGGMGFFRISTDYAHPDSFEMEARIDRIPNPLMVHWDTSSTGFDASDWEYAFISDMIAKDEFKARYPDAALVPFEGDSREDASDQWINDDDVRVAEYFLRTEKERKLFLVAIPNGNGGFETKAIREKDMRSHADSVLAAGGVDTTGGSDDEIIAAALQATGAEVRAERDAKYYEVSRRIISGSEVLEEDVWPGSTIPICPVWGDEVFLDGRRHFRSLIRDAKDPQLMFNLWRSATTELVASAPKAPWVGPQGFVPRGQEDKWASANTRTHAYLEFNPDAGPPSRTAFAGPPAGALQEALNAADDMKAITGIYDSSVGARSNETSGRAILARERQGDISNFHFIDNLSRAIQYAGKCLVEIIPSVYSERESVRILGEDSKEKVAKLTTEAGGGKGLYNLSIGKYDVTVDTGPSFATQRVEARETLIEIMRQVPDAAPVLGDVLLDNMDFSGADRIAKRLEQMLPQAIRDAEGDEDNPEAAALRAQMKAQQQQVEQLKQQAAQEFEKIQKENEALKEDRDIELQRLRAEVGFKDRELRLKEMEAATPPDTAKEEASILLAREKMAFDASEGDKDRAAALERALISKNHLNQEE